ncbi:hypothetical protein PVAND_015862 [Polypedilum vanderplanki]|uniref:Uncharacterized protein n=1 Tax=Polypedilum vanderplanki TaxID=319348 RepID=A0A9J6BDD8_POLVA|nr:hypothetical protein PVAND_015862 [Polypedilum vanderplanki]
MRLIVAVFVLLNFLEISIVAQQQVFDWPHQFQLNWFTPPGPPSTTTQPPTTVPWFGPQTVPATTAPQVVQNTNQHFFPWQTTPSTTTQLSATVQNINQPFWPTAAPVVTQPPTITAPVIQNTNQHFWPTPAPITTQPPLTAPVIQNTNQPIWPTTSSQTIITAPVVQTTSQPFWPTHSQPPMTAPVIHNTFPWQTTTSSSIFTAPIIRISQPAVHTQVPIWLNPLFTAPLITRSTTRQAIATRVTNPLSRVTPAVTLPTTRRETTTMTETSVRKKTTKAPSRNQIQPSINDVFKVADSIIAQINDHIAQTLSQMNRNVMNKKNLKTIDKS